MSDESRTAIQAVLAKHYSRVSITMIDTLADLEALGERQPDLVFLGMQHLSLATGTVWISEYLEEHDIAYTGSNKHAHKLEHNKHLAKQRVLDRGLVTSKYHVVEQHQLVAPSDIELTFPVFIKPPNKGGGVGIDSASVARDFDTLSTKVQSLSSTLDSSALIEEYLPGREFSVAILKNLHDSDYLVMPLELIAEPDSRGLRLLSQEVKNSNTEATLEVKNSADRSKVTALALNVFHALGARDYGRIDIRMDAAGTPHFLEANLIPSIIGGYGSFPKACMMNQALEYEPMILHIVELGLLRNDLVKEIVSELFIGNVVPVSAA